MAPLKKSYTPDLLEAGCDEVGCGCLAGPVVAAVVIFPKRYFHKEINDSKKIHSHAKRQLLAHDIKQNAINWAVAEVSNEEIDAMNIRQASICAMHRALDKIALRPELILVDGNTFKPYQEIPFYCFVKGDTRYLSIAAASILAKTYRDELMRQYALRYEGYGWEKNVGYPTQKHKRAIQQLGISPLHRKTFALPPKLPLASAF